MKIGNTLSGRVTDADNNPIPNASVTLNTDIQTIDGTDTNETGYYEFTGVDNGTYTIDVIKDGYVSQSKDVTIEGDDEQVSFALRPNLLPQLSNIQPGVGATIDSQPPIELGADISDPNGDTYTYELRWYNGSAWETVAFGVTPQDVRASASVDPLRGDNQWSIYVSDGPLKEATYNFSFTYRDENPFVSQASPKGGVYLPDRNVSTLAKVVDPNGNNVSAWLYELGAGGNRTLRGSIIDTPEPVSVGAQYEADAGQNSWQVVMNDGKTNVSSVPYSFETPNQVRVYGVVDGTLQQLDSTQIDATIQSTVSRYYDERTASNGLIDLEGVPDETHIVSANAAGYDRASIVVDDPAKAQSIILYPDESNDDDNNVSDYYDQGFYLTDNTGNFPPEDSFLSAAKLVDGDYRSVASGYFGAGNFVDLRLENGSVYRLSVRNDAGDTREIGTFEANEQQFGDTEVELVISQSQDDDPPSEENDPPVPDFDVPDRMVTNTTYMLDAAASSDPDGQITAYYWDLDGDNTTDATGGVTTVNYTAPGAYNITLTVTDDDGANSSVTQTVVVGDSDTPNKDPVARFDFVPERPAPGETIDFDAGNSYDPEGNLTSYAWDFDGDGTTDATGESVTHNFSAAGSYPVTLTVTDGQGATATLNRTVIVEETNQGPIAIIDYSPRLPEINEQVRFNASEAVDPDGSISSYEWDFDGDGTTDATGETANYTYVTAAEYNVTLTVTDGDGATGNSTRTIIVRNTNQGPAPAFEWQPRNPNASESIQFNASASNDADGDISAFAWDVDGDGAIEYNGVAPSHSYATNGTYNVTLTVTDDDGANSSVTETLIVGGTDVNLYPSANFTVRPDVPVTNSQTTFDGTVSTDPENNITAYEWDLNGDGAADETGEIVDFNYTSTGIYNVTLTVTDGANQSATMTQFVRVTNGTPNLFPAADFTVSPDNPVAYDTVAFDASNSSDPENNITKYEWDFDGDGQIDDTGRIVLHEFTQNGSYDVTLIVTDGAGQTARMGRTVKIAQNLPPSPSFTYTPLVAAPPESFTFNASASTDPEGNITGYQWDFDDDGTIDANGAEVVHSYATEGTYNVTLTVTDEAGNMANLTQTVIVDATVPNSQPVAIIDYRPNEPAPSQTITLDGSGSYDPDALIDQYRWDTDNDGEWDATGKLHNVSYDAPGIYPVRLEVRDERGATNVSTVLIPVGEGKQIESGWAWDANLVDRDGDGNKTIEVSVLTAPNTTLSNVVVEIYEHGNPSNRFPNYSLGEVNSAFITQDLGPNESEKSWVVVIHATQSDGDRVSDQIIVSPGANTTPTQLPGWVRAGLSFIVLLLSAGLFSRINFGAGAVVIALEGGILWWTGWLTGMTTGAAVGFAMFIAIISYIQQRSAEARL